MEKIQKVNKREQKQEEQEKQQQKKHEQKKSNICQKEIKKIERAEGARRYGL
jgi:hypothetical protein